MYQKSIDPTDNICTFATDPEAIPDRFQADLERVLWELWFSNLKSDSCLDTKKEAVRIVSTSLDEFVALSPLVEEILTDDDLTTILKLMLPHLPANVVRL